MGICLGSQKAIDLVNLKTLTKGRNAAANRCVCCLQLERVTFLLWVMVLVVFCVKSVFGHV